MKHRLPDDVTLLHGKVLHEVVVSPVVRKTAPTVDICCEEPQRRPQGPRPGAKLLKGQPATGVGQTTLGVA